ncbi:MAG: PA2779 family protein, partial [Desulfovibrionales bacterium]
MSGLVQTVLFRRTAMLLILVMGLLSSVPPVDAGFIPTGEQEILQRDQDLQDVQKVLENKMVQKRLEALGYSQAEIQQKLDQLSDSEVHALSTQLNALNPGGNGLGIIVTILVIVLLVVVILKLTNKS